jgi:hypothetical protein
MLSGKGRSFIRTGRKRPMSAGAQFLPLVMRQLAKTLGCGFRFAALSFGAYCQTGVLLIQRLHGLPQ